MEPIEAAVFYCEYSGHWYARITWKCPICGRRNSIPKRGTGRIKLPIKVRCRNKHETLVLPYHYPELKEQWEGEPPETQETRQLILTDTQRHEMVEKLEVYLTRRIQELRAQGFNEEQVKERLVAVAHSEEQVQILMNATSQEHFASFDQ